MNRPHVCGSDTARLIMSPPSLQARSNAFAGNASSRFPSSMLLCSGMVTGILLSFRSAQLVRSGHSALCVLELGAGSVKRSFLNSSQLEHTLDTRSLVQPQILAWTLDPGVEFLSSTDVICGNSFFTLQLIELRPGQSGDLNSLFPDLTQLGSVFAANDDTRRLNLNASVHTHVSPVFCASLSELVPVMSVRIPE